MSDVERHAANWLRDRLGWTGMRTTLSTHRVPRLSFVFYLGGITLFLFLAQVASGVLMVLYYQPDAAQAFASVKRIDGGIPYGHLVRAVHQWAGDLFVASLLAHLFTILVRRSFRPPHELSWFSGILSLLIGIGMAFTGAVLPWNQTAYTHARIGSEIARYVPFIGEWLKRFMRGGDEVTSSTLGHAFGFHVAALPAALTALIAFHLFFLSRKPAHVIDDKTETIPLYPDFFVRQAAAFTGVTVVLMTLAIFVERPLGTAADLGAPSSSAHPPWYFLPVHQIIRVAPKDLLGMDGARFLVGAGSVLGLVLLALPFIDRRGSKVTAWLAWGLLLVLLLLATSALY